MDLLGGSLVSNASLGAPGFIGVDEHLKKQVLRLAVLAQDDS
jgi:hypothetical protein